MACLSQIINEVFLVEIQVQKTPSVTKTERHLFDQFEGTEFKFILQMHTFTSLTGGEEPVCG